MVVCEFCELTPCSCSICTCCGEKWDPLTKHGVCEDCSCEECGRPLENLAERNEGIHVSCMEKLAREHDLAVANGFCSHCERVKATTSYIDDMGEHPVCRECYDSHNETEAVWTEFVVEHGRKPSLIEYLEAGEVFESDDNI